MSEEADKTEEFARESFEVLTALLNIKAMADGKKATFMAQGQALDGYTELAAYRRIIGEYEEKIAE